MAAPIFVDKLEAYGIGGWTSNLRKIHYNLARVNLTMPKLLAQVSEKAIIPTSMFHVGRYISILQFSRNLSEGRMALIDYQVNLQQHFDIFADALTPQTVNGFHKMQQIINTKSEQDLNLFFLSEDSLNFPGLFDN